MKIFLIILLFLSKSLFLHSQINEFYAGARSGGMANASLNLCDLWSIFNNPAGLSKIEASTLGLFYENRFGLKETGYGAIGFAVPTGSGNFGIGATHFGYSLFQTNKLGLSYAQELFETVSMGAKIDYISIFQSNYYGNIHAVSFDIGVIAKPTNSFSIGFHVFNPLDLSYISDINERLPTIYKLGFAYFFSDELIFAIETGKAINGEIPVFKLGIEYLINKALALRTGFATYPIEYSFGIGYILNNLNFDIAYTNHQILGNTPKASVNYVF